MSETILKVSGLEKYFGTRTLFTGISFDLRRGEKVGLVGANGTGKTTLFRCLLGREPYAAGQVSWPRTSTVGYVEQATDFGGRTLRQELLRAYEDVIGWETRLRELEGLIARPEGTDESDRLMREYAELTELFERADGYAMESRIRQVTSGLGFTAEDGERPADEFSGGQKTRITLARELVRQPDFLLLDEPTNHLDMEHMEWLEEYLGGYPGGVLVISHDRYFLDSTVQKVWEIDNCVLEEYHGNYSAYLEQKTHRRRELMTVYEKQQDMIADTEAYIRKYKAGIKSKQARGRQSRLERMERLQRPEVREAMQFLFPDIEDSPERVAEFCDVSASYGTRTIFERMSFLIRRTEKVAVVGPNGAGKTTILKMIMGELLPVAGRVRVSPRAVIGYYSQEFDSLHGPLRVVDEIMISCGLLEAKARKILGRFLFKGDDVFRRVEELSGGEKARLSLVKVLLSGANVLILDEPTNHLDIPAREAVEEALELFPGAVILVSHDRYLIDKVADRILSLEEGHISSHVGNYSEFKDNRAAAALATKPVRTEGDSATKKVPGGKATTPAKNSPRTLQRKIEKAESEIAKLEAEFAAMELRINDPLSHADPQESLRTAKAYEALKQSLEQAFAVWQQLVEEGEE